MTSQMQHQTTQSQGNTPAVRDLPSGATKDGTEGQSDNKRHPIEDRYNTHDASFRRHYQLNYRDSGHEYETFYAPAYRFGYEFAEENRSARWETVMPEAQRHWQSNHHSRWAEVVDAAHYGWKEQRDPEALRVHHNDDYANPRGRFLAHYEEAGYALDAAASFEHYEPAYQHGYNLAIDGAYRTRLWEDIEPEIRQYYENEYAKGEVPWEHYQAAAHYAWHDARAVAV